MHPDIQMTPDERMKFALAYAAMWGFLIYVILFLSYPLVMAVVTALAAGIFFAMKRRVAKLPEEPIGRG